MTSLPGCANGRHSAIVQQTGIPTPAGFTAVWPELAAFELVRDPG